MAYALPFPFSALQQLRQTRGQQPTLQSQQPTPQDYADALEAYGRQQPIRTPGALASNLAASAIQHLNTNGQAVPQGSGWNLPASFDPKDFGLSPSPLTVDPLPAIGSGS